MHESMNEQFEVMPFAVAGQQMEQYLNSFGGRGRTGRSMGGRSMGGRAPSFKAGRLAPRSPAQSGGPRSLRYPRWGWPYPAALPYPAPYWYGQPEPVPIEPAPVPDDWAGEPPAQEAGRNTPKTVMALPSRLKAAVEQLPAARRPQYQYMGTVDEALASLPAKPRQPGDYAGLYLLVFGPEGKQRAYSGQSENVRRRILQHKLFGHMLGRDIGRFDVFVHPMPRSDAQTRRALEEAFHAKALALGMLTNQKQEFESRVIGQSWV